MVTVCLYGGHTGHVETKKMANKDGILVHYSLQEAIFNEYWISQVHRQFCLHYYLL